MAPNLLCARRHRQASVERAGAKRRERKLDFGLRERERNPIGIGIGNGNGNGHGNTSPKGNRIV